MNLTYLALGDSYTVGESVPTNESFPAQTVQMLQNGGFSIDLPKIIAVTGWTTDELDAGIKAAAIQGNQYDFVSLLIGVNNQYRGRSLEEYETQFTDLLRKAIGFSRNGADHVVVLSIPDWGVTPFAADRDVAQIAKEIDAFNAANKRIAADFQVHYIDITPFTREAVQDSTLVAADGLHPSGKDYQRWAKLVSQLFTRLPITNK
ncbi:MAG: SGNH/GDSL hydrolase family protein [Chitinophaga sp.]|uniref:SGNH/GDSL hydrolase family protein n=1 Tax=Chitinophaga sp. TaxID=1869181 RepID=UPI0025BA3391|nr:SGNH/GDSL hydrolase family protein [Chitinophaga sp.]MBV8255466.1 SGNH/GDSL hydrolase family protein [Chitinophaga sp.]